MKKTPFLLKFEYFFAGTRMEDLRNLVVRDEVESVVDKLIFDMLDKASATIKAQRVNEDYEKVLANMDLSRPEGCVLFHCLSLDGLGANWTVSVSEPVFKCSSRLTGLAVWRVVMCAQDILLSRRSPQKSFFGTSPADFAQVGIRR